MKAYQLAGKAAEVAPENDDDDEEEEIAKRQFRQFQFSSVKENSCSITITTEKSLHTTWLEIMKNNFGTPQNKGTNGFKFDTTDSCDGKEVMIYLTLYKTGTLLVQAE